MKESYTHQEVMNMLVGMFIFSGANNNQGLSKITGKDYGNKAEHVIKSTIQTMDNGGTVISAVPLFSK
jgi:hypothetical protein